MFRCGLDRDQEALEWHMPSRERVELRGESWGLQTHSHYGGRTLNQQPGARVPVRGRRRERSRGAGSG